MLLSAAFAQTIANQLPPEKWNVKVKLDGARTEAAAREVSEIEKQAGLRAAGIAEAQRRDTNAILEELTDHPLSPGRYPSLDDLVNRADDYLEFSWAFDGLLPLAVGLLIQPVARPFDIDADQASRLKALEHLIFRVRDRKASLPDRADGELTKKIEESLDWASKQISGERRFSTKGVLMASGVVLLGVTGVGLAVAAPAGVAGAAVLTATLAGFGPGGMVGGLVTLAALTGSAGALGAAGVVLPGDDPAHRLAVLESAEELANASKEDLEDTLRGILAVVHAQASLDLDNTESHVRGVLAEALGKAEYEFTTHNEFAKRGPSAAAWAAKRDLLEKSLSVLDAIPGSVEGAELRAARQSQETELQPEERARFQDRLRQLPSNRRRLGTADSGEAANPNP